MRAVYCAQVLPGPPDLLPFSYTPVVCLGRISPVQQAVPAAERIKGRFPGMRGFPEFNGRLHANAGALVKCARHARDKYVLGYLKISKVKSCIEEEISQQYLYCLDAACVVVCPTGSASPSQFLLPHCNFKRKLLYSIGKEWKRSRWGSQQSVPPWNLFVSLRLRSDVLFSIPVCGAFQSQLCHRNCNACGEFLPGVLQMVDHGLACKGANCFVWRI